MVKLMVADVVWLKGLTNISCRSGVVKWLN